MWKKKGAKKGRQSDGQKNIKENGKRDNKNENNVFSRKTGCHGWAKRKEKNEINIKKSGQGSWTYFGNKKKRARRNVSFLCINSKNVCTLHWKFLLQEA